GHNRPGIIQVFCQPESGLVKIYILDERGSLFQRTHEPVGSQLVLGPYALFLGDILQRYALAVSGTEYYLVERDPLEGYTVKSAGFQPESASFAFKIRVLARETAPGRVTYPIFCNELEFTSMDGGQDVFARAAAYI